MERPNFEELKETGLSIDPQGSNIYTLPNTFGLDSPAEYFHTQILGALERDFDRTRRDQYYKTPNAGETRNAGDVELPTTTVYGPSLNSKRTTHLRTQFTENVEGGNHLMGFQFPPGL